MVQRKNKDDKPSDVSTSQTGTIVTSSAQTDDRELSAATTTAIPETGLPSSEGGLYNNQSAASELPTDAETISWTASEFIAHQKSASWYVKLVLGAIIVAALVYLLTKDKISTSVVLVGALVLGFYGARKPRQLEYQIDAQGVTVGQKHYSYSNFRSFAVVPEGAFSSIIFIPMKRFATLTTIYFAPADEDRIIKLLSSILPIQEYRHDPVDQLMKRIRF